ncbi:SPOR domain-containing protein [Prevotella sp. HJM029]|uniref:SPOR domain-containing protein n=1 Tax=Prevotella sp. HJM029 TaxID=1433844 RepID=UPI0004910CA7|nr:SPOR domain-containing protein [Prevotella sp. HJM029]
MKKLACILWLTLCATLSLSAQTFLDHIKKREAGMGVVTVTQSKDIDEIVNGRPTTKATTQPQEKKENPPKSVSTTQSQEKKEAATRAVATTQRPEKDKKETRPTTNHATDKDSAKQVRPKETTEKKPNEQRETTEQKRTDSTTKTPESEEEEAPIVDMRKKVMRGSRKIVGFRVQAFAGGNSRIDRQKAEQASIVIKTKYPEEPVYVHFYSPHWICRVGNYRTFEEANSMLQKVKALGYRQANIVKGKITVQD